MRWLSVALLLACGPKPATTTTTPPSDADPASQPEGTTVVNASDPRVSRSAGEAGGVVVLWPRIIPAEEVESSNMIAGLVQDRMKALVERTLPGKPIDVRPQPERTCPQAGCSAVALGVLILRQGESCAAIAFVMPPGTTESTTLVPWYGGVKLKSSAIPFRGFPESEVTVTDYGRCNDLPASLDKLEADVAKALRAAGS
jgi:hypothetical protein